MSEVEIRVRNRTFLRFGIVAVVVLAAFALRQFMVNYLGLDLPAFITFYPAVMLVAMLAGFWPGLLATVLASLLADYWIFPPIGSFAIAGTSNVVRWAFFAGTGVFMSLVAERYRRNQQRMAAYEREQALRESKEKLLRSEEQFETLANAIPQLCWMANPDGWIFWYNQRWYDYTGTTPEQMEGWRWRSVHDPEKLPKVLEQWKASIATGEPFDMVFPLRDADGAFRPFLTRVMPVKGPKGEVVRWFGTNTDISAQKQAEEELREREMLLRTVTESSRVGLVMLSADRHYLYANAAYAEVLGLSTPDIIGKRVPDVMGHVYDQISPRLDRAFAGERVNYELKVPAQQGTGVEGRNRFYAITYEPLQGHGEGSRVIVVVVEITERKQAEEALRSSQARMQGIIGSAMDAVISVDERQRIIVFNRAAEAVFQCAAAEAVGSTLDRFIPKSLREVHHEHIRLFGSAGVTARSMNSPGILAAVRSNGDDLPITSGRGKDLHSYPPRHYCAQTGT
jgi:PAS domain S-box-containing protein